MEGERIRYPEIDSSSEGGSISPNVAIAGGYLFVAVGKEFKENKSTVIWALQHSGGKKIWIIHVIIPPQMKPNSSKVGKKEVMTQKETEEALDEYIQLCATAGVNAQKLFIEADSIENGIITLISQHMITRLVMGAGSDYGYRWGTREIKSEKAKYVNKNAPGHCQIWFVCNNNLIHTRKATVKPEGLSPSASGENSQSSSARIPSAPHFNLINSDLLSNSNSMVLTEKIERLENENARISKELQEAQYKYYALDSGIMKSDLKVKELEQDLASTLQLAESYKKSLDDRQRDSDNAIMFCLDFPSREIQIATYSFDPSLKTGEDAYGNIHKGFLRRTEVAVKIPHPDNPLIPQEFQKEVEIMCKMRHPNIVNLIGICTEFHALVYEQSAILTLEDQLNNKDQGSHFGWKIRVKFATELCNVLAFLHSHKPNPIIHGDLRPVNINLDSNYTCKLNGFKISQAISNGEFSLENKSSFYRGDSEARSYPYLDPEFFTGGELTTKSDVYAFGVILLRLLTGKQAVRLARQVQIAVESDELSALLDTSAEWPIEQAKQLAELALRCCDMSWDRRPDLEEDVCKIIEAMK